MRSVFIACVLSTAALLAACSEKFLFEANEADSRFEAGETNLSIISVTPWEEIADELKPNFNMKVLRGEEKDANGSGQQSAMNAVFPTTSLFAEKILDVFTAALAVNVRNKAGIEQQEAADQANAPKVETTFNIDREKFDFGDAFKLEPSDATTKQDIEQDPMLRHELAAALIQRVAELNTRVERAAMLHNYEPYLVNMQISSVPYVRHQPYDIYAQLSFFNTESKHIIKKVQDQPYIVPLVVTDNIEGSLASRSARVVRQLAVAASVLFKGVSGSLAVESLNDKFEAVMGTEQNSLFTIGRVTDNTVRIRLGAPFNPTSEYAMIPRTHTLSVLVLVSRDHLKLGIDKKLNRKPRLSVAMITELRHVSKGRKPLPSAKPGDFSSEWKRIISKYFGPDPGTLAHKMAFISPKLLTPVQTNDWNQYSHELKKIHDKFGKKLSEGERKFLWAEIAQLSARSRNHVATFEIPASPDPNITNSVLRRVKSNWPEATCHKDWDALDASEPDVLARYYGPSVALLQDSGSDTVLKIGGVGRFNKSRLAATLVALTDAGKRHILSPKSIEVSKSNASAEAGDTILIKFDKLSSLNIGKFEPSGSYIKLAYAAPKWRTREGAKRYMACSLRYTPPPPPKKPKPAPAIPPGVAALIDDGKTANITFNEVSGLVDGRLTAVLFVEIAKQKLPFHATSVEFVAAKRELSLNFPSLKALGIQDKIDQKKLQIVVHQAPSLDEQAAGAKTKLHPHKDIRYLAKN